MTDEEIVEELETFRNRVVKPDVYFDTTDLAILESFSSNFPAAPYCTRETLLNQGKKMAVNRNAPIQSIIANDLVYPQSPSYIRNW